MTPVLLKIDPQSGREANTLSSFHEKFFSEDGRLVIACIKVDVSSRMIYAVLVEWEGNEPKCLTPMIKTQSKFLIHLQSTADYNCLQASSVPEDLLLWISSQLTSKRGGLFKGKLALCVFVFVVVVVV